MTEERFKEINGLADDYTVRLWLDAWRIGRDAVVSEELAKYGMQDITPAEMRKYLWWKLKRHLGEKL